MFVLISIFLSALHTTDREKSAVPKQKTQTSICEHKLSCVDDKNDDCQELLSICLIWVLMKAILT